MRLTFKPEAPNFQLLPVTGACNNNLLCLKAHNLMNQFLPVALANPPLVSVLCLLFAVNRFYMPDPAQCEKQSKTCTGLKLQHVT